MKASLFSVVAVACFTFWFSTASARSWNVTPEGGGDLVAPISSSVHYYAYGGDPQAVMITVTVHDSYQGDFSRYQWVYEVVNNSYNPSCYPFASNGFSGIVLYLDSVDDSELGNIESPGPGWVIGTQYPFPINWDIVDADGIMPGGSGTFSFTTLPRYTATVGGYFNTRCFGTPMKAVHFTASDGPEGPGALKPPGACYLNGSCQLMQEANCNHLGGTFCSRPKALLVAGHGDVPLAAKTLAAAAHDLWDQGWLPLIPPSPTLEDIAQKINADPCIRGLYITSHGTSNGSVVISRQGNPQPWRVRPADLAAVIPGTQLDFLTVLACYVQKSEWQQAFPQSRIVIPDKFIHGVYDDAGRDLRMQRLRHHGTPLQACDESGLVVSVDLEGIVLAPGTTCPSFAICDSVNCGADLFPVTSCADSVGVSTGSMFSVAPPDSMFDITVHLPSAYSDSVACGGSYYTNVPDDLVDPGLTPLGRFLLFADVQEDSSVVSDSLTVMMKYLNSDLLQSGIAHEERLAPYWTSADSVVLQLIPAVLDTVNNCMTFSVPRWGLVGIYESGEVSGVDDDDLVPKPGSTDKRVIYSRVTTSS